MFIAKAVPLWALASEDHSRRDCTEDEEGFCAGGNGVGSGLAGESWEGPLGRGQNFHAQAELDYWPVPSVYLWQGGRGLMGVLRPFLIPEAKPTLILLNLCL